jgi:DNA-binding NarL/FixJ family response regulator
LTPRQSRIRIRQIRRLQTLLRSAGVPSQAKRVGAVLDGLIEAATDVIAADIAVRVRADPLSQRPTRRSGLGFPVLRKPVRKRLPDSGNPSFPPEPPTRVRVLIVESHAVFRMGIARYLDSQGGVEVIGESSDFGMALLMARHYQPNVVLIDVRLPGIDVTEAVHDFLTRCPNANLLLLCSPDGDSPLVEVALSAGAAGFVLREGLPDLLLEAVRGVARGDWNHGRAQIPTVIGRRRQGAAFPAEFNLLAPHHLRLLPLIAKGRTNSEIARELSLSELTVKTYVSQILRQLKVRRRAEAAALITRRAVAQ